MAVTSINIIQDNKYNGSDLLPVNSPLIFLAEVNYTDTAPDTIFVNLYDTLESTLLDTFKAIPFQDTSTTQRLFIFDAALLLRDHLGSFEDSLQSLESLVYIPNVTKELHIEFEAADDVVFSAKNYFTAIYGANQFSELPNKYDIYTNETKTYYCKPNSFAYVYFFLNGSGFNVDIFEDTVEKLSEAPITGVGYYRYKVSSGTKIVKIKRSDEAFFFGTHNLIEINCANDAELKYLDKNCQYRFTSFNEFYEINDKNNSIGSYEKQITSIYNNQTNRKQIGKDSSREVALLQSVDNELLEYYADLVASPRVYYRVGTTDNLQDWLEVEVITNNSIIKQRNGKSIDVSLTIKLPERFNINAL